MTKADDTLRQLGWQRLNGNPIPDILWYVFTGRADLNELDVSDVEDFPNRDIHMDCIVRLIRDPDDDTPEELRPYWRLTYQTNVKNDGEDSGLSFDELEAFYKKLKELIRKEKKANG